MNRPITRMKNGMTRESLIFVIEGILSTCVDQLCYSMPDIMDIDERISQSTKFDDSEPIDSLWYPTLGEVGIIAQAIDSVSFIVNNSIGIDVDVDTFLGGFEKTCDNFISVNWEDRGEPCLRRVKRFDKMGDYSPSDVYLDYPDARKMATRLVNALEIE